MDEAYSSRPPLGDGEQVWIGKGSWTWSEKKFERKRKTRLQMAWMLMKASTPSKVG